MSLHDPSVPSVPVPLVQKMVETERATMETTKFNALLLGKLLFRMTFLLRGLFVCLVRSRLLRNGCGKTTLALADGVRARMIPFPVVQ